MKMSVKTDLSGHRYRFTVNSQAASNISEIVSEILDIGVTLRSVAEFEHGRLRERLFPS